MKNCLNQDSLDNTRVVFVNEAIRNFDKQRNT